MESVDIRVYLSDGETVHVLAPRTGRELIDALHRTDPANPPRQMNIRARMPDDREVIVTIVYDDRTPPAVIPCGTAPLP